MASLRETKDRIGSVKSTLKITSAMKLVASSKLRKAQRTIESMRPYEEALTDILASLGSRAEYPAAALREDAAVAVVAISSNSSLCGAFNANVIKRALAVASQHPTVVVYPIGRRIADAMKKAGYDSREDYSELIGHPSYDLSCSLASELASLYSEGKLSKIVLVYNHFVSTSHQELVEEIFLPFSTESIRKDDELTSCEDFIVEPSAAEVAETLLPQVLMLRFHAAILDSAASEHAARTVAIQTATDNAKDLLGSLTLEYNKGRQQKITAEILDLLGGASANG